MDTDAASISGSWVLDVTRSDTMGGYLRHLHAPEHFIQRQVAGEQDTESRNVIAVHTDKVVFHKSTVVNNFTETHYFGADLVKQTEYGQMRTITSLVNPCDRSGLVTTVSTQNFDGQELCMLETRQLTEGGQAHTQVLTIQNVATEEYVTTRRTWMRVPTTSSDIQEISVEMRDDVRACGNPAPCVRWVPGCRE